jgi:hypothetical protein
MALFKKFNLLKVSNDIHTNETNTGIVINPSSDKTIWIDNQPHEYNSLFPIFKKDLSCFKKNRVESNLGFVQNCVVSKGPMTICGQESSWSSSSGYFGSRSDSYMLKNRDLNLEDGSVTNRTSTMYSFEDSSSNKFNLILFHKLYNSSYPFLSTTHYIFIEGDDFSNPNALSSGTLISPSASVNNNNQHHSGVSVYYVDTANKYLYFHARGTGSTSASYRTQYYKSEVYRASYTTNVNDGTLAIGALSKILATNHGSGTQGFIEAACFYYGGKNNDNTLMFFEYNETDTARATATTAVKSSDLLVAESYNVSSGSTSTVATLTTSNLTTPSVAAKPMMRPRPSQFYNSTIEGEGNVFYSYYPCCDNSDVITFIRTKWDKSANSSAGSVAIANCTMTYGSGIASDYIAPSDLHNNTDSVGTRSNTFITKTGSDYHLHYLPSYGNSTNIARNSSTSRNLVTYTINASNWSTLTYHSSIQVDSLEFIHLNNNRNKIAVISPGFCKIYTWNDGWSETASEGGTFIGITQDAAGRLFGLDGSANIANESADALDSSYYFIEHKVKLISDTLPNTVSIVFANENLTYSGSNVSSSIAVNAYNSSSARIAKSVVLKIDGANAQFTSNSSKTLTATTSSSADTTVGLTITGPGPVTISGSFAI